MQRGTISISSDSQDEESAFQDWLHRWEDKLKYISEDYGCGCCVHLFDIEGPEDAISDIPEHLKTVSKWTETGMR